LDNRSWEDAHAYRSVWKYHSLPIRQGPDRQSGLIMVQKLRVVAEIQPVNRDQKSKRAAAVFVKVLCLAALAAAHPAAVSYAGTASEAYIAASGGTMIAAGRTEIDGHIMRCGAAPTILDPHFGDFGGSFPGFIVLNPRLFAGLPTPVKLWIFGHECAHQKVGPDEVKADCAAVQRGRADGWLDAEGLKKVCAFMAPARGDRSHFNGPKRCALMHECLARRQ
jgi:hypothetical protein